MLIETLLGKIDIISTAGCETRIYIERYKSLFDIGFADSISLKAQKVFISHTHADHVSGIWRHAAMQEFMHNREGLYYAPSQNIGLIRDFLDAGRAMNHCPTTKASVYDTADGVNVNNNVTITSFETDHRIPSCGFIGIQKKKKLKSKYVGINSNEISRLSRMGEEVNEITENVEFAYSGDTRIDGILNNKDALNADLLIMECTHLSKKTVKETRENGHIHINEIIENRDLFNNKQIVLMHFSRMYSKEEVEKELLRVPENIRNRILVAI